MAEIILVEDDHTLGMTLELSLVQAGHSVIWCPTLARARDELKEAAPDLFILDLGLPDGDGLDFCGELRAAGSIVPVIILTARVTLEARVAGLTGGADDYVTKPFELPELVARVEALLRRQGWHQPTVDKVQFGQLSVDFRRREVFRGDEEIELTNLELRLLQFLVAHEGKPVAREDILTQVWGLAPDTRTRSVDVFVSRLRRHIEVDPSNPKHLLVVRGVGYKLRLDDPSDE